MVYDGLEVKQVCLEVDVYLKDNRNCWPPSEVVLTVLDEEGRLAADLEKMLWVIGMNPPSEVVLTVYDVEGEY